MILNVYTYKTACVLLRACLCLGARLAGSVVRQGKGLVFTCNRVVVGLAVGVISLTESESEESERFHFFRFRLRLRRL